ncbi:uncharacterized protein LOC131162490 isoform X2 [Malania oleifera]|uniref:uncharacterized protein LOC131162490 isoform X2 n=1 Tax=Malania oleifera TaxID=397392 RepID=UPI0025AE4E05|nr:uncharacterized protein LOC131162490 isoform X2 [Malania oleifera]XP_057975023.1 uncharacterized protein LOC131162490 isoform X2 [Malania oleifera]
MASATVGSPSDGLRAEEIPVVDLRLLSQSELHALSLSSSPSFDLHRVDDIVIPKIDRSVFNESAGSRKQTYSRLRLAPGKSELATSGAPIRRSAGRPRRLPAPRYYPDTVDDENNKIVGCLKQLFAAEDYNDNLVQVEVEYGESVPEIYNVGHSLQEIPIDVIDGGKKRRRGSKPKSEKLVTDSGQNEREAIVSYENPEDRDREILNKNGILVDAVALANAEDPFGSELSRRTEGLETEMELLGFLRELNGEWGSRRKKRKIVDASDFGDALPKGWKLLLRLKRKEGRVWLICSRYISPNGRRFLSCKEVSSYLLSFLGAHDASQSKSCHCDGSIQLHYSMVSGNAADLTSVDDNNREDLGCCLPSSPFTSLHSDHKGQIMPLRTGISAEVQAGEILKCHECAVTFDEQDELGNHVLLSHKTVKRQKVGAYINNRVIIKDGQYECEFCHKSFHELKHYNGHIEFHLKSRVNNNGASSLVMTGQESIDPASFDQVPPRVSDVEASIGFDGGSIAKHFNAKADNELNSGFLHSELNRDTVIETCTNKYSHEDKEKMKANINDSSLFDESCDKKDRDNVTDEEQGKVDIVVAKLNIHSSSTTASSNNRNKSGGTDIVGCMHRFNDAFDGHESTENCSLAVSLKDRACHVENNANEFSTSLTEDPKTNIGSQGGLPNQHDNKETCSVEHYEKCLFTNTMQELKIDDDEKFESNGQFKQQGSPNGCLVAQNDEKCGFVDNMNKVLSSSISDSQQERGNENVLVNPGDEQMPTADNNVMPTTDDNVNRASSSILDVHKPDEAFNSRDSGLTVGFGSTRAIPDENAVTSVEQERISESCSLVPSWNEQTSGVENNVNQVSTCQIVDSEQEKCSEGSFFSPFGNNQLNGLGNNASNVFTSTMEEPKSCESKKFNRDPTTAFGCSHTNLDVNVVTNFGQERSFESFSFGPSGNEQRLWADNDVNMVSCTMALEPKQDECLKSSLCRPSLYEQRSGVENNNLNPVSTSIAGKPKLQETKSFLNNELTIDFGSRQAGLGVGGVTSVAQEISFEGCSLALSGAEQMFGVENNVYGVYSSTMEEQRQGRGFISSLLSLSGNEQASDVGNIMKKAYTDAVWEGPRREEVGHPGSNEPDTGLGSSSAPAGMWKRGEGNGLQDDLTDSMSLLGQQSSCFHTFDIMSNKGENEIFGVNEKFDRISGLDRLRSGSIEHLEFDFLTSQTNSLSDDSKVLSYDGPVEQGFDTPVWLETEALLPKIASRHQISAICVWCRNEFLHEAVNPGIQAGSIGLMCPTCKARF